MTSFVLIIITFIIDNLFSNLTNHSLLLSSLVIIYLISNNKFNYLITVTILGFIYDLFYSNIPIYLFIYFFLGLLIVIYFKRYKTTLLNIIILFILVNLLTNNYTFCLNKLSFIFNFSYFLIIFYLLKDSFMSFKRYRK